MHHTTVKGTKKHGGGRNGKDGMNGGIIKGKAGKPGQAWGRSLIRQEQGGRNR